MNTLQDLRATLDQHAAGVPDSPTHARVAAVHGRARAVRRRRAAAVGGAAVLAVVAAATVSVLPGDRDPAPAERELIGREAPATVESLGYTYHFAEGVEGGEKHAEIRLRASDEPRLITWASDADEVGILGHPSYHARSRLTDFDDFVLVPAGQSGRWSVRASGRESAIAVYELGDERPPGHTADGITFREQVGTDELLAARIGDRGQSDLSVELTLPSEGEVRVADLCQGELPKGYWVNYEVGDDGAISVGGCVDDAFDPGGVGGHTFDVTPRDAGRTVPVRAWISRRIEGPAVTVEEVRLGVGVYDVGEPAAVVAGWNMPELKEHAGHLWRFVGTEVGAPGEASVSVRNETAEVLLAVGSYRAPGRTVVELQADPDDGVSQSGLGGGGSDMRALLEPGDAPARLRVRGEVPPDAELGFALYERVD